MTDKLIIDYDFLRQYTITPANAVGPTTSTTLRTVTAHDNNNSRYVRKFGIAYEITEVTDIEDPVDTDMKFWVYALDGTLLGSRVGGGAFVAGTTLSTAQACYMKVTGTGTATMLTTVLIDTDVDAGGKDFVFPAESVVNGTDIDFYLSQTTSTYYDEDMTTGGARHTPDGTQEFPYFKIQTALDACDSYFPICTVLDSATYDEDLTIDGAWTLQAALGQTPKITRGIGPRVTREIEYDGNNVNSVYIDAVNGSDTTGDGTYQNPVATIVKGFDFLSATRVYYKVMDSSVHNIGDMGLSLLSLEPGYGYVPTIKGRIAMQTASTYFCGFKFDASKYTYAVAVTATNVKIHDNEFYNYLTYGFYGTGNYAYSVYRNRFLYTSDYSTGSDIYISGTCSGNISYNFCSNAYNGIYIINATSLNITHNICFDNNSTGICLNLTSATYAGNITNNLCTGATYGIYLAKTGGTNSGTISKNICWLNDTYDIMADYAVTVTYFDYGTKHENVTANNSITTDPQFVDSSARNYALKIGSGAYKTDGAENDIGPITGNILVSASTVAINGFYLDGQDYYSYGIYKTGATDYTGLTVKWCDIQNYNGRGVDDYAGAATSGVFSNNKISDNGNGIYLPWGATTFDYNIVYTNTFYGLYRGKILGSFNHNVFFGNLLEGYHIITGSTSEIIKNSIFYANGNYGINSVVNIYVYNSCINDSVSTTVSYTQDGNNNITDAPLFINENNDTEDFRLKSISRGYIYDSPCIEGADDGYSMGAYLETEAVTGEGWKTYQLEHEPANMNIDFVMKGSSKAESGFGAMYHRGKGFKMILPMEWGGNQYTSAKQTNKIRYFQSRVPTVKNSLTREECLFRLWILPQTFLDSASTVTISTTALTITASGKDWVENQWVGFWAGVRHALVSSGVITTSTAQVVKSGAGWTTDQWAGYYYRYDGKTYLILSNNSTTLQLSDPNGYLANGTVDGYIEQYYKITSNTATALTVEDPYDYIISTNVGFYIAFVRCYVSSTVYGYRQPMFAPTKDTWKAGYQITFEEE